MGLSDTLKVFPVGAAKQPLTAHGFKDAAPVSSWPEHTGRFGIEPEMIGCCVVDVDPGGEYHDPDCAYVVETPRGGHHYWYRGSLPPSVGKVGPNIDTRGRDSYVVLYRDDVPEAWTLTPVPEHVVAACAQQRAETTAAVAELDLPVNVERARDALAARYERDGPWGQEDDPDTYALAAMVKDLGCSEEMTVDLLCEHGHEAERDWLEFTVRNAFKYGQNEAGAWGAGPLAQSWIDYAAAQPAPTWPAIVTAHSIKDTPFAKPAWAWQDRLLAFEPNLYTGLPGVGKTTLSENIAVAVAAGAPLLGAPTTRGAVFLLVAEDTYGPVRDNLLAVRQAMGVDEGVLTDVHLLSVKSDKVNGGHVLANISDEGVVNDTAFMRECVAPFLAKHTEGGNTILWILDPLAEFVRFNNLADNACRALATHWLGSVCSIGSGNGGRGGGGYGGAVTVVVNDHPSKASVASGHDYAGSVQLASAFSFVATLKAGAVSGGLVRQQAMEFQVKKGRYAGNDTTHFWRLGSSPAFAMDGPPGFTAHDIRERVYAHIVERLEQGLRTGRDNNHAGYPLSETAHALNIDEAQVRQAMGSCLGLGWLVYNIAALAQKRGAGFDLGPQAPEITPAF
jgi:hypothetical protein